MDNINDEFEKYYTFAARHIEEQQQQQQSINEQHTHRSEHITQPYIPLENSHHDHADPDSYNPDLLNLLPNDFYSSQHFNNVNSSSHILMNSQYKPIPSDQTLLYNEISTNGISHQMNANNLSSSIPTYPTSNQSVPSHPMLYMSQLQSRSNENDSNFMYSAAATDPRQVLLDGEQNSMMPLFKNSQTSVASSRTQPKSRQEQDVFCELISLATKDNRPHNMNPWHVSHGNVGDHQYVPSSSSSSLNELSRNNQHQHSQQKGSYKHSRPDLHPKYTHQTEMQLPSSTLVSETKLPNLSKEQKIVEPTTPKVFNERIYRLSMAQQPSRARMCGFGDKDRRPISPPPIVQLTVTTQHGQIINPETFDVSFLVVICDSWQQTNPGKEDVDATLYETPLSQVVSYPTSMVDKDEDGTNPPIKMKNLVGSSVASASKLYDLSGKLGIYFIFQDVSLRTEGCFRLKFSLMDVGSPYTRTVNTAISRVLETIHTEPFMVYTAKKFPGVVQSTLLSKCFAQQGIKIPIRKEKTTKNNLSNQKFLSNEQSEEEDD